MSTSNLLEGHNLLPIRHLLGAFTVAGKPLLLPYFSCYVKAGFPSPAESYLEDVLDLNELLVSNPPSTFLVRSVGDSMIDACIAPDAILIVDRSVTPKSGHIVVAYLDGEFTVKRLKIENKVCTLIPANSKYKAIVVPQESEFIIWGVVTYVINKP